MMIMNSGLEVMSKQNIETINRKEPADLSAIHTKQDLPQIEKIPGFPEQIKNPYYSPCGDVPMRVCFTDDGPKLDQILEDYLICIKQG